jgi:RimJ/RimL family protein N-acetyltransferase
MSQQRSSAAHETPMDYEFNHLGQPIGPFVREWKTPPYPLHEPMEGRYCRLEPLDPRRHAESLFAANILDVDGRNWTYLPYGPFENVADYRTWIEQSCCGSDPQFYAIIELAKSTAVGIASYLRINPISGSIEVGHINYSPLLQRTPAATEAMYLLMERAFGLGYRRYEWKCDALNAPSRAAAQRLGLSFEGIFRQATIVKGRNRDTAWYAATDYEWSAIKEAFVKWLSPSNFDQRGQQRRRLSALTAPILNQSIVELGSHG